MIQYITFMAGLLETMGIFRNLCIYLDGVPNHFTERWWGMKTFSVFKMGYEIFFHYQKLFSALVPRIQNDHSLMSDNFDPNSQPKLLMESKLVAVPSQVTL